MTSPIRGAASARSLRQAYPVHAGPRCPSTAGGPGSLGAQTLLIRRHAARRWPFVGSIALAISIIGPTWLADGLAGVVLICMHVAVGLVLIAGFTRLLPRPADQLSDVWR